MTVESGGNCNARGASGEGGCLQYMPGTWRAHSLAVYGEVRSMTPERERYVATRIIQRWLDEGKGAAQIALMWNQGHPGQCKAGVNRFGVHYDSCAYKTKVLAHLR